MIPEFALKLICGLSTIWCVAPRSQITSGFFRIQMLIGLGLSVLFLLTKNQLELNDAEAGLLLPGLGCSLAICSFAGSVAWTLERRKGGAMFAVAIVLLSTAALISLCLVTHHHRSLRVFETLTAAWLIGAVTATMLLGHWYLTATGMSLTPFEQYNRILIVALVLRIVSEVFSIAARNAEMTANGGLLTLRWAGLLGPLMMALLTVQILKYRNTQSATGILYAATTLVFMGEMAVILAR